MATVVVGHRNKRTMGQNADRNAQFENSAQLKEKYLNAGKPVIILTLKMKELLGNFYREGITDAAETTIINDHDFPRAVMAKLFPMVLTILVKTPHLYI